MSLATYRSCSFAEKRAVLGRFWGGRADASDKVNRAAVEYGPYALAMNAVIAAELLAIWAVLVTHHRAWSWAALAAAVFALWCVGVTRRCQVRARSLGAGRPEPGSSPPL